MSRGAVYDELKNSMPVSAWSSEGRVFAASDADQNDLVTGQTSFADTSPTFSLVNPAGSGVYLGFLRTQLNQTGSVGGGAVDIILEVDNANRYSSGGTAETPFCLRTDSPQGTVAAAGTGANKGILYSNPTLSSGFGVRLDAVTVGPDVSPAEGAIQKYEYDARNGIVWLAPGSCLNVYTYAAATGPTWLWSFQWVEIPAGMMGF